MTPLYLRDDEISLLVLGPKRTAEWRGIVAVLERSGFPKIDPTFGGRYWRACERWFDRRHGLRNDGADAAIDGSEQWESWEAAAKHQAYSGAKTVPSPTGSLGKVQFKRDTVRNASD